MIGRRPLVLAAVLVATVAAACGGASSGADHPGTTRSTTVTTSTTSTTTVAPTTTAAPVTTTTAPATFTATISSVTAARLGLSWHPGCPVAPSDLRLLTLGFRAMDGSARVGELIVNARIAARTVAAFRDLWDAGFPINRMDTSDKFLTAADFDAAGNYIERNVPDTVDDTAGFMCRAVTAGQSFSQHAYGMAIDINPLQNPEIKGSLVVPINGVHDPAAPGTIVAGGAADRIMTRHGFVWGGTWRSLKDFMHFSPNGQ